MDGMGLGFIEVSFSGVAGFLIGVNIFELEIDLL